MGGTDHADSAYGFVHGDGNIAKRRVVDSALELVRPGRVGEEALDAEAHFVGSLFFADSGGKAGGNFFSALREIFREVIEHLGAVVGGGFCPGFCFARGFDGVANVFAIAQRRFAEQFTVLAANFERIPRIGRASCRR